MSMIDSFNCCLDSSVLQFVVRLLIAFVIVLSISEVSSLAGDEAEAGAGVLRVETESAAMVGMWCVWPTVITGTVRSSRGRENCRRSGTTSEEEWEVITLWWSYGVGSLRVST